MRYRSVKLAALFLASLFLSQPAFSIIIAEQDFNSLSSAFTSTTDSLPSGVQLTNAGSKNIGGPGLDFSTTWFDTRGGGLRSCDNNLRHLGLHWCEFLHWKQ